MWWFNLIHESTVGARGRAAAINPVDETQTPINSTLPRRTAGEAETDMEIKELLVPTDFSDNAEHALSYAMHLAKRSSAKIHLLHVPVIPTYPLMDVAYSTTPDVTRRMLAQAQMALEALTPRLREEGVEYETALREGVVHKAIHEYALDRRISMVVMGARGRTSISKLMYGSVAERVLKTLSTPTIVVPPQGAEPPHSIVIAYDFSLPAKRAAEAARAIHGLFHGPLYLVHAYTDTSEEYPLREAAVDKATEIHKEALRLGLSEMLDGAAADLFSIDTQSTQTRLVHGYPADTVLKLARDVDANLICAGTTGKGGIERLLMGSVARRLVHDSPLPVLLTHDDK